MDADNRFNGNIYNLLDVSNFRDGPPHAVFDQLRQDRPVHSIITPAGRRVWALTRYADIRGVTMDSERFSNTGGPNYYAKPPERGQTRANVIWNDAPYHTRLRHFFSLGFSPRVVQNFAGWIRELALGIIDNLGSQNEFDFVEKVSSELPALLIAAILGMPREDHRKMVDWANALMEITDTTHEGHASFGNAFAEVSEYAMRLRGLKLDDPGEDMVTMLNGAVFEGEPITDEEYIAFFVMTIAAAFETTHSALAQSMLLLTDHPDVYDTLKNGDAKLLAGAVDEFLRLATPPMHMMRTAKEDVMVNGTPIASGEAITLWFSAANRDPALFQNPHELDIRRANSGHASFGTGGPHFCVGNRLARLEMQIMFEELFRRYSRIERNGEFERVNSIFLNGLRNLPVHATI